MFTVFLKVCQNPKVKSIENDKEVSINPKPETTTEPTTKPVTTTGTSTTATPSTATEVTATPQCSKIRGGEIKPRGSSLCRIYMTKDNTKADCRRFVRKMTAMDTDSQNNIQFVLREVSHHRQRPVIIAMLNLPAVDMVSFYNK